jgi:hypothetical protein
MVGGIAHQRKLRAFLRQTIMPFFKLNEKRLEAQG